MASTIDLDMDWSTRKFIEIEEQDPPFVEDCSLEFVRDMSRDQKL
jgi:hypothetical protein